MSKRILLIEDEADLSDTVSRYFQKENFYVECCLDGVTALKMVQEKPWDLVVLDLNLPDMNGIEICRSLRTFSPIPIIMTTARVEEADRIRGLEMGADDYVCKPYSPRELVARVRAIFRRLDIYPATMPSIQLDDEGFRIVCSRGDVSLTRIEYRIFRILYTERGSVVSRDRLQQAAYDDHRVVSSRNMDSHIAKLRKKLKAFFGEDGIRPVYGAGYLLDSDAFSQDCV